MQIFVLGGERPDVSSIVKALRLGRIEVLASHPTPAPPARSDVGYVFAGWTLDPTTRALAGPGEGAELTSLEFDCLTAFLRRPGETISRAELTHALKGRAWDYLDRSIDTLIARLRKKLDAPGAPSLLRSVRGVGYVLCAPVTRTAVAGS